MGLEIRIFSKGTKEVPDARTAFGNAASFLEQTGRGPHPFKNQSRTFDLVDEDPVRLDVAVPASRVVSNKPMVAVNGVEGLSGQKSTSSDFEFDCVLAPPNG